MVNESNPFRHARSTALLAAAWSCAPAAPPPAEPVTLTAPAPPPPTAPHTAQEPARARGVRFPAGGASLVLGCFAASAKLESFACVLGHFEPEADATSAVVSFLGGRETRAAIPLVGSALDEATRQSLDAAMVDGEYREIGPPAWESPSDASVPTGFHIVIEPARLRVEHDSKLIHERVDWYLPRYRRTCSGRAWSLGHQIAIERTCYTVDEGVKVVALDAFVCDSDHCR